MSTTTDISKKTQAARVRDILRWCDRRSINQVYKFFHGCDKTIEQHENRIRLVMRTTPNTVNASDEPWIASMEATVAALNARKPVAA